MLESWGAGRGMVFSENHGNHDICGSTQCHNNYLGIQALPLSSLESSFFSGVGSGKHFDKELRAEASAVTALVSKWTPVQVPSLICEFAPQFSVFSESFNHQGMMWSVQRLASHLRVFQTGRWARVLQAQQSLWGHPGTPRTRRSLWGQGGQELCPSAETKSAPGWQAELQDCPDRQKQRADSGSGRISHHCYHFLTSEAMGSWLSRSGVYLRDGFLCIPRTSGWAHLSLSQRLFQLWA